MIRRLRLYFLLIVALAVPQAAVSATDTTADNNNWTNIGTANVYDPFLWIPFGMAGDTWDLQVAESVENPGIYKIYDIYTTCPSVLDGSFVLTDPAKGSYMIIDTRESNNVKVTEFALNVSDSGYGEYLFEQRDPGTCKSGVIRFPVGAIHFGLKEVNADTKGYYNTVPYEIKLPNGPDGSVTLSDTNGLCGIDGKATFNVTHGKDAVRLKIGVFEGKHDPNSVEFDLYDRTLESGKDFDGGDYEVSLPYSGWQTVAVISVDSEGDWMEGTTHYFFNSEFNPDEWVSLGKVDFQDDTFLPIYGVFEISDTRKVELLESKLTPNYYRVMNPWDNFPNPDVIEGLAFHSGHTHYFDLDATYHPMMVAIPESPMGVSVKGQELTISHQFRGNMLVDHMFKFRANGINLNIGGQDFIAGQNGVFAVSVPENYHPRNLMITVVNSDNEPIEGATFKVVGAESASGETDERGYADFFLGGLEGTTREVEILADGYKPYPLTLTFEDEADLTETVVLEKGSGIDEVDADAAAPRYYNLQGIEIDKPAKGIYIERRGSKVTKIIR